MKTFLNVFGGTLLILGIIAAAGSAGDCDGHCGPGNDFAIMMLIMFGAVVCVILGAVMIHKANQ